MSAVDDLVGLAVEAYQDGRDLEARLAVAAALAALAAPEGVRPVLVGGSAVDFYAARATRGMLVPSHAIRASADVDIITVGGFGDERALRLLLGSSPHFRAATDALPVESCRDWWLRDAPVMVQVLGGRLAGDPDRLVTLEVDGAEAYLWSPEDTAWQYAENAWSMRDRHDWARARAIAAAQDLDWAYMAPSPEGLSPPEIVAALRAEDSYEEMHDRVAAARRKRRAGSA